MLVITRGYIHLVQWVLKKAPDFVHKATGWAAPNRAQGVYCLCSSRGWFGCWSLRILKVLQVSRTYQWVLHAFMMFYDVLWCSMMSYHVSIWYFDDDISTLSGVEPQWRHWHIMPSQQAQGWLINILPVLLFLIPICTSVFVQEYGVLYLHLHNYTSS